MMNRTGLMTFALLLITIAAPSRAGQEPLTVRARVTANTLNVAQRTTLNVVCELEQGWTLVSTPFDSMGRDDTLGPLLVAAPPRATPAQYDSGIITRTWSVELAPDLPAQGDIPALRFKAQRVDGSRFTIKRTAAIPVVVESLLNTEQTDWDPTALRPALGLLPEPAQSSTPIYLIVGAALLAIALTLTVTLIGKQRRDPARLRNRRLNDLLAQLNAINPENKSAIGRTNRIVRESITELAGPRALATTGAELVPLLRTATLLAPADTAMVCDFIARVDAALYTGEPFNREDAEALRADARRIIQSVKLAAEAGGER